jgi:hypothetical protein
MEVAASSANMVRSADILKLSLARAEVVDTSMTGSFDAVLGPLAAWDDEDRPVGLDGHTFADVAASGRFDDLTSARPVGDRWAKVTV